MTVAAISLAALLFYYVISGVTSQVTDINNTALTPAVSDNSLVNITTTPDPPSSARDGRSVGLVYSKINKYSKLINVLKNLSE